MQVSIGKTSIIRTLDDNEVPQARSKLEVVAQFLPELKAGKVIEIREDNYGDRYKWVQTFRTYSYYFGIRITSFTIDNVSYVKMFCKCESPFTKALNDVRKA